MPILEVEMVIGSGEVLTDGLAEGMADAAGDVFGAPAGRTWVRLHTLPASEYAENGGGPPEGIRPVFVTVLRASLPKEDALREETRRLTEAIATACGRPAENVHILWLPEATGRMAFGGRLMETTESR